MESLGVCLELFAIMLVLIKIETQLRRIANALNRKL